MVRAVGPAGEAVLKCLTPPVSQEEDEELAREYLLLDALAHPAWVRPRRLGRLSDGGMFLELDPAEGTTLPQSRLRGWCPEVLEVARWILSGLETLHRLGFAHLDLHPDQILLEGLPGESSGWAEGGSLESISATILDLGLAAPVGAPIRPRGTPGYVAPEILKRDAWDSRADLYGFGALLFELLTGHPAFVGADAVEILEAQVAGEMPDARIDGDLPPPIRRLLRELLSPRPPERPAGAMEIWQRLREHLPRGGTMDLPAQLIGSPQFAFQGRTREIEAFKVWLRTPDAIGDRVCRISGEPGIGRKRLAGRLRAVAQIEGWEPGPDGALAHGDRPARILFEVAEAGGAVPGVGVGPADSIGDRHPRPGRSLPTVGLGGDGARLVLQLGGLDVSDLDRMLRGRGVESEALRRLLRDESLGSPGLLDALYVAVPRELDLAARYAEDVVLVEMISDLSPPRSWVEWADREMTQLSEGEADLVVRQALYREPMFSDQNQVGAVDGLRALERRSVLLNDGKSFQIRSGLWAEAWIRAQPDRTRRVALCLLDRPERGGLESPVGRAKLALRLGSTDQLREDLGSALDALHDGGRFEDELALFCRACAASGGSIPDRDCPGEERLRRLVSTVFALGTRVREHLDLLDEGSLTRLDHPGRLLAAWRALARREFDDARSLLDFNPHRSEDFFTHRWLRFRLASISGELDEAASILERGDTLSQHPERAPNPWLVAGRGEVLNARGRFEEAASSYESGLDLISALPPGEQATYRQAYAVVLMHLGRVAEMQRESEQAEATFREFGFRLTRRLAVGGLSAVAYLEGQLPRAAAWARELLGDWLRGGHAESAIAPTLNLALIQLDRGRLADSLRAISDARDLVARLASEKTWTRVEMQAVHVFARTGLLERAMETAARLLQGGVEGDPRREPFVRMSQAEALFAAGRTEQAREEMQRAVTAFEKGAAADDAAETRIVWGLYETALQNWDRAEELHRLVMLSGAKTTRLTEAVRILLEGEISGASGAPRAAALLKDAVQTLESQDRWYFAWRAHWALGRCHEANGRSADAVGAYGTARSILTGLLESLGTPTLEAAFLALPAPRAFLADLDGAQDAN